MKRKPIPKEVRQQVYDKYNGHCAYCGCELEYKHMQVDHLDSVYRAEAGGREASNDIENLMPACRMCNFYKGTATIEELRRKLLRFEAVYLAEHFNTRLAVNYGMVALGHWDGKFYFEKEDSIEEHCKSTLEYLDYIRGEETNERTQETHSVLGSQEQE